MLEGASDPQQLPDSGLKLALLFHQTHQIRCGGDVRLTDSRSKRMVSLTADANCFELPDSRMIACPPKVKSVREIHEHG